MASVLLEIIFNAVDLHNVGIEGRDEIEEPLHEALIDFGLGEITGGGSSNQLAIVDVEIEDEERLEDALSVIRAILRSRRAPGSTIIKRSKPTETLYGVYD
jgi:hypothetical protein